MSFRNNDLPAPAARQVLQAAATARLPLANAATVATGCTLTLPADGTYQLSYSADLVYATAGDGALVAQPYVAGAAIANAPQAIFAPGTVGDRAVVSNTCVYTGTAGQVLELRVLKTGAGGTSYSNPLHTQITALQV